MKIFSSVKIWQKFLFTGIIFLIPIILLIILLISEKNIAINFARKELTGTEYLKSLSSLYKSVCLQNISANTDTSSSAGKSAIDSAAQQLRSTADKIAGTGKDGDLNHLNKQGSLFQNLPSIIDGDFSWQKFNLTVINIKELWRLVGNNSNLILDPDIDSFYLMDFTVIKTPEGVDLIRKLTLSASEIAKKGSISESEKTDLTVLTGLLHTNIIDSRESISTAVENDSTADKSISLNISKPFSEKTTIVYDFTELIETRLLKNFDRSITPEEIASKGSAAIEAYFETSDMVSVQLNTLLMNRINHFTLNKIITLSVSGLLILAAGLCGVFIMRSINRRISEAVAVLDRMSEGDITVRAEVRRDDEFGFVLNRINHFLSSINTITTAIDSVSKHLSETSRKMSAGSNELTSSASQQTSEIEEINATMEECAANIESIEQHSSAQMQKSDLLEQRISCLNEIITDLDIQMKKALQQTSGMTSDIQTRQISLRQMKSSMEAIDSSSREMAGIISIIRDISDQINLLSLNASIEAARAGEFGRGFAVVADEVSKLADSTAQSIKNIDTLIKRNDIEIEKGIENTASTLDMISSLIDNVGTVSEMIVSISKFTETQKNIGIEVSGESSSLKISASEVNSAILQQKSAMDEILHATTEISELTKSNADNAQHQSETSLQLLEISESLEKKLSFFKR